LPLSLKIELLDVNDNPTGEYISSLETVHWLGEAAGRDAAIVSVRLVADVPYQNISFSVIDTSGGTADSWFSFLAPGASLWVSSFSISAITDVSGIIRIQVRPDPVTPEGKYSSVKINIAYEQNGIPQEPLVLQTTQIILKLIYATTELGTLPLMKKRPALMRGVLNSSSYNLTYDEVAYDLTMLKRHAGANSKVLANLIGFVDDSINDLGRRLFS